MDVTDDTKIPINRLNVAHSKLCITIRSAEIYKSVDLGKQEPVTIRASLSENFEIRQYVFFFVFLL